MKTERNILIAFILNLGFAIFELFGGLFTNSVAIMSDAIHDIGDALSIGVSYFLEKKSKKQADNKYTYGYTRYSVLGASITSAILLIGSILVIYRAIIRLVNPETVNYDGMIVFAIVGVIINSLAAYFTHDGDSMNQRAVNLHMLEDVLGWVIVLIGSIVMKFTDIVYIDSVLSIGVAFFILINSVKMLLSAVDLFLEKTPQGISVDELKHHLLEIEGIISIHDLHIWSLDGINHCATLHVVVDDHFKSTKKKVREELHEHGIAHVTIEMEIESEPCGEEMAHLLKTPTHSCCGHHHHHHVHHHGHGHEHHH